LEINNSSQQTVVDGQVEAFASINRLFGRASYRAIN